VSWLHRMFVNPVALKRDDLEEAFGGGGLPG